MLKKKAFTSLSTSCGFFVKIKTVKESASDATASLCYKKS